MTQTRMATLPIVHGGGDFTESPAGQVVREGHPAHPAHGGEEAPAGFQDDYIAKVRMEKKRPGRTGVKTLLEVHKIEVNNLLPGNPGCVDTGLFQREFAAKSPAKWNLGFVRRALASGKVDRLHPISFAMIANPTLPNHSLGAP